MTTPALAEMPSGSAFKIASSTQAGTSNETSPPVGWTQFCRDFATDARKPCTKQILPAVDVKLDQAAWREMVRINAAVNREIEPMTDIEHWGVIDRWDFADDGKGDCEDYVLVKRERLMKVGFPRQALLVTVVRDLEGEGHAVLTVKTDKGDYILDNMNSVIKPWTATGYKFVKRQSQESPNVWVSLGSVDTAIYTSRN
ncbi:MAG: transglutaminase-like cysteine peptidase [Beijerinckiaceae bacterium]|nr:transglutaminase-like cysteine peptidase [Beijerinckiaceae bacterium]